jgi:hypothetical protein
VQLNVFGAARRVRVDVAGVHRGDRALDYLDVLPRHRLLPQPHGFEASAWSRKWFIEWTITSWSCSPYGAGVVTGSFPGPTDVLIAPPEIGSVYLALAPGELPPAGDELGVGRGVADARRRSDDELHPLREVPRRTWSGDD